VVHTPRAQNAAYTLGLILRTEKVELADVALALRRLEPTCAALCAERPDRAAQVMPLLDAVQAQAVAALDGPEHEFLAASSRFHTQLVASCGNATMILVAGALESIWMAHAEVLVREEGGRRPTMTDRKRAVMVHAEILEQIRSGDTEAVYRATHHHLEKAQMFPLGNERVPIRLTGLHGFPAPPAGWSERAPMLP
jgi:DNA-binding GntR family transcriptional regulator